MVEYIISTLLALLTGLFCGYRLGRAVSAGGAGRRSNQVSSSGFADTEDTVERAIKANEDAADTIQRMRDIINRHNHDSNDTVCEGKTE